MKKLIILFFLFTSSLYAQTKLKRTEKKHTAEINQLNVSKEKEVHEAKIKFFTMIAHEIRTPVSLIIGPLEKIMKSSIPMPAVLRDDLNIIDRNSQRLLFLVNQLLDFRKVEQEGITMMLRRTSASCYRRFANGSNRLSPSMVRIWKWNIPMLISRLWWIVRRSLK